MDDEMHRQLQSAACQQISISSSSRFSLFGTAAACCLCLLAAIYCIVIIRRFIVVKFQARRRKQYDAAAAPPPPPGRGSWWWWSVVETVAFVAANRSGRGLYHHFVEPRHSRYGGPCFRTALFGATHVFVSSPDAARSLLTGEQHGGGGGFSKRYVRSVSELLGEHSLLCASSHAAHRALRRAVAPLFNAQATASLAANFDALTRRWISSTTAGSGTSVVVLDAALDLTFEAICDMLIGGMEPEVRRRLQSDVLAVTRAMLALPLLRWLPGARFHAGLRARKRIMDLLRHEIAERNRQISMDEEEIQDDDDHHHHQHHSHSSKHHDDFLQSLLLLRSKQRNQLLQQQSPSSSNNDDLLMLTDDQILDNILTLIIAGQVTTASAITWMVKYLSDNKDFQETLRSVQLELALKHKAENGDGNAPLTLQHLNSMDLAYMTVKESLRMASIVSWFPRVALKDCQVAGFHINKGWIVNIDARALHYDATLYDNPTMFDPLRFKGEEKQQSPYSFLVFGAGGRTCLGMNLAKIMMLIFLHHLVTNWRWEMADDDPSLEKWAMFPRLKSGCPIHLTPI